jgi:PEGA domain-containing protein
MKDRMKWIFMLLLLFGVTMSAVLPASAAVGFRGGFFVGPPIRPLGWYAPYYEPYGFYRPYVYPNAGEVKLDTKEKDAEVFINGAYAGTAGKLKSMWMRPGSYQLEIRAHNRDPFTERIYVLAGKTLHVHPNLRG